MTLKSCKNCGDEFIPKRKSAKYCSSACRQQAFQKRQETLETDSDNVLNGRAEEVERYVEPIRNAILPASSFDRDSFNQPSERNHAQRNESHGRIDRHHEKEVFDRWYLNGITPFRYPKHYYTPGGGLTAEGWKGIDPLDRKALAKKPPLISDYMWLEEDNYDSDGRINIYADLIEEIAKPKVKKIPNYWNDSEVRAVERYSELILSTIESLKAIDGASTKQKKLKKMLERLESFAESSTFRALPWDCPEKSYLSFLIESVTEWIGDFEDEDQRREFQFAERWYRRFKEVELALDLF